MVTLSKPKTDNYYITYIWNLKNNTNESIHKKETHLRKQTDGHQKGKGRRDKLRIWDWQVQVMYIKIDKQQKLTM